MTDAPSEPPVPLADAEIAQHIADAARSGRAADRAPTVEQLLAAFGEGPDAGEEGRRRVGRALALAAVGTSPALVDAGPGDRVTLTPGPGGAGGRGGGRRPRTWLLAGLALAAVTGAAVLAAGLTDGDGDRASSLPASTSTVTTAATTATTTATTPASTASAPTAAERAAAAKARRDRAARKAAAERRAAARRKRATAARRRVTVTLAPAEPSYVCIDDDAGRQFFGGTLSAPRTFRARRMRLNIGLSSVRVRVDGKPLALSGSPSGYLVQRGKAPVPLPLGQRPEC